MVRVVTPLTVLLPFPSLRLAEATQPAKAVKLGQSAQFDSQAVLDTMQSQSWPTGS